MLAPLDYVVIAGYLLALTAFGSWFARFQRTPRDYFLSDRSVPWWGVCFTIVATETSTVTFIGVPAAAYAGDMTFLQLGFGYVLGRLLVSLVLIPAYFRGELYTSYELLQRRFGGGVKNLAAGIFLLTRSLADGIRLFATALVIAVVTRLPVTWIVLVLGIATIVYTTRGGVAAVIWTDVIQMFVYIAGAVLVFLALLGRIPGGWDEVVASGSAAGKLTVLDLSLDPGRSYTLWAGLLGGMALTLATHGTDQFLVQRLLSARSARAAAAGLSLSGLIVLAQFVLFLLIGVMLSIYHQHEPLTAPLSRNDEVLPGFIVAALPRGAAGFVVAAIVAAALSPSLNAMASTTVNDFYLKYVRPAADVRALMRISRAATIGWGLVQIAVALGAAHMSRSVLDDGLSVLALTAGPVLGAFLVGVLTTRVRAVPTMAGMLAGLALCVAAWWSGAIAFTWFALIGVVVTAAVALLADAVLPRPAPSMRRAAPTSM